MNGPNKLYYYAIMNLDSIIDIGFKWTFSTLSELKRSTLYSTIKNILSILSKLKHLRFSVLDSLCLNEAKLLCNFL
jgi:hypothetical protein